MRRQFEAVVPLPENCAPWFTETKQTQAANLGLRLSPWPMPGVPGPSSGPLQWPESSSQSLARLAPFWAHFDVVVLPVAPATLAWTRTALANWQSSGLPALVVIGSELSASAMADLVQLGVQDFILHPDHLEELCVRIALQSRAARRAATVGAQPVPLGVAAMTVAESQNSYPQPQSLTHAESASDVADLTLEWVEQGVRRTLLPEDADQGFQFNRNRFLRHFEREYVCTMLRHYRGNVTHASRAGGITRRSFWRLMRKFGIESATFRREAQEGMTQRWRTLPLKSGGLSS